MAKVAPIFYKPKRSRKVAFVTPPKSKPPAKDAEMGLIQGQTPGSLLEWNASQALDIMGLRYEYQYTIGKWGISGSQKIDFLVYTPGLPTPVLVNGRYWHTGVHEDAYDTMNIKKLMHYRVRDPLVIWEENCQTVDDALAFFRQHLSM